MTTPKRPTQTALAAPFRIRIGYGSDSIAATSTEGHQNTFFPTGHPHQSSLSTSTSM